MGIFSFIKGMGGAEGTRSAMLQSYRKHLTERSLAPDTTPHEAALYGALASRYVANGVKRDALARAEPFLWLELLPFRYLGEDAAPEVLAEYVVWKEKETKAEARKAWLTDQIRLGARLAYEAGEVEALEAATGQNADMHSPWVDLLH